MKNLLLAMMPKDRFLMSENGKTKVLICYRLFGNYIATRTRELCNS